MDGWLVLFVPLLNATLIVVCCTRPATHASASGCRKRGSARNNQDFKNNGVFQHHCYSHHSGVCGCVRGGGTSETWQLQLMILRARSIFLALRQKKNMPRAPAPPRAARPRRPHPHTRANNTKISTLLRKLAGNRPLYSQRVEDILVGFFEDHSTKKGLLDRVHRRACQGMRRITQQKDTQAHVVAMHDPLNLVELILNMGSTKSGYRHLVTFCPAFCSSGYMQFSFVLKKMLLLAGRHAGHRPWTGSCPAVAGSLRFGVGQRARAVGVAGEVRGQHRGPTVAVGELVGIRHGPTTHCASPVQGSTPQFFFLII